MCSNCFGRKSRAISSLIRNMTMTYAEAERVNMRLSIVLGKCLTKQMNNFIIPTPVI